MTWMLAARDALGRFYGKYDTQIRLISKFFLALWAFTEIRMNIGQNGAFSGFMLLPVLALACAFLPSNGIVLMGAGMIMVHYYSLSLETAVAGGGILLIGMLVYFSISTRSAYPLILTALLANRGLGCAAALLFGLTQGPLAAVGVAFGAAVPYLTQTMVSSAGNLQSTAADAAEAMVQKIASLIGMALSDEEMFAMAVVLAAVMLLVYLVRVMEMKYAWTAAAVVGALAYTAARIALGFADIVPLDVPSLVIEIILAILAAAAAQLMLFSLDYKKTETVRFEDDEYYYYVKAVPKQKIRRKKRKRRSERR